VSDNVTVSLFGSSAFTLIVIVWLTVTLATTGVIVKSGGWLSENTYDVIVLIMYDIVHVQHYYYKYR
jgi:hypothetical protein